MNVKNWIVATVGLMILCSILPVCNTWATTICGKWDSLNVLGGEYRISNNVWGSGSGVGEQCLEAFSDSTFFAVYHSTHNDSGVCSYPFILKGCHWGSCTTDSNLPMKVSNIIKAPFEWSIDLNGAGGKWNAAYESWFSQAGRTTPDHLELMIWINYKGVALPAGSLQGTISIGGYSWQVYYIDWTSTRGWQYMAYRITSPVTYVNLDLKDFVDDAISRGFLDPSSYLDNMEAGFEIWRDGQGLTTNYFYGSVTGTENDPPTAFPDPNSLLIENFVKQFFTNHNYPHANQGLLTYIERAGNLNEIDVNDVLYVAPATSSSKIVSLINTGTESNPQFATLSTDARPENTKGSLLELSIYNKNNLPVTSENELRFWLPNGSESFKGKTLTIRQFSPGRNSNITYPVWDIRKIIEKNYHKLPLNKLVNQKSNTSYSFWTLSTSGEIADLNEDGNVNLKDHETFLIDYGKTGPSRSDISSSKDSGLPDGVVNDIDGSFLFAEINRLDPNGPYPNPYTSGSLEDFETGGFGNINWEFSGEAYWFVTSSQSKSGSYSAQAGDIEDGESSTIMVELDCDDGSISFYRKVSSESGFDCLRFFIDGAEKGSWSGSKDWAEVTFPVTAGRRTFAWTYSKDGSVSDGEDAAWIDDIVFPP